jgi:hypothetical protein
MDAEPHVPDGQEGRRFPLAFVLSAVLVTAIVGGVLFVSRAGRPSGQAAAAKLPFGAGEQAYAAKIQIGGLEMSRAANLLNQEITYLSGVAQNRGERGVGEIEVTIEFRDALNQVVLRETRRILGTRAAPLGPGQSRTFQVSFDHVPADWNVQLPGVRVTGLALE